MEIRVQQTAQVRSVKHLGNHFGLIRVEGEDIGHFVSVGRFALLKPLKAGNLQPRPYSYCLRHHRHAVSFLVKDLGATSSALLQLGSGDCLAISGPLGQGFVQVVGPLWCVAGGVGVAPFGLLPPHQHSAILLGIQDISEQGYQQAVQHVGVAVDLASLDGSVGFFGNVVALLQQRLATAVVPPVALFTCGPLLMMEQVKKIAESAQLPCFTAYQERPACGSSVCRGCVWPPPQEAKTCLAIDGPKYHAADA